MPDILQAMISNLAERLLKLHQQSPDMLFYGTDVLGSMFRDADLARLDSAYNQLAREGLMERTGEAFTYFGVPKKFYQLTKKGEQMGSAA